MKKFILMAAFVVASMGAMANNNNVVETAKCAIYTESVVSKEYINGGKDVRLEFMLLNGSTVRVTVSAKDYMRFALKEAAYDLVMLSDKSVVMRPTLRRQPR